MPCSIVSMSCFQGFYYTGCFIKFVITCDVNITETIWSRLMILNKLNVEQYEY